ncbi:AfsA-related hotdog domain-containing protein [Streptomyces pseudovenezuelae]|uniref:AfsA-related hotdog domain-containing protein n=1 Tax=Streptomyces pseudovenezuelae TaxID=67350 RepID=UPI0034A4F6BC
MPELRQFARVRPGSGPPAATVSRGFVHRVAVAEILLSGWSRTGKDRFIITAQWPRAHRLHVSSDRSAYEPPLVAETVHQCGALLAHAEYEVPLGRQFGLHELRVDTRSAHLAVGANPAEPVIDITVSEVHRRADRPTALRYGAAAQPGGERVATGRTAVSWTNESVHRRLRGGRTADVLLSPDARPGRRRLRFDTARPVFFGHPQGHIPACPVGGRPPGRTGARRTGAPGTGVVPCTPHLTSTELDRQVWAQVGEVGGADVQVIALQGESMVSECLVSAVAG